MINKNKISVILIVREESDFLIECIRSISKQKNVAELFFLNPYDINLKSAIKELRKSINIITLKNKYIVESINYAISIAKLEFITILGSDERFENDSLNYLSTKLIENNNLNIVWGLSYYLDRSNNFLGYALTNCETDFYTNLNKPYKELRSSSFLIRKSIFNKLGKFNKRFNYHFFLEFIIRVYKQNKYCIISIPNISSKIIVEKYNLDNLFDFEKDIELLDLSLSLSNIYINFVLEKRIYQYVYSLEKDFLLKKLI